MTAVVPSRAQQALEAARATLRSKYRSHATTLGELAGRRVAIDPTEAGVAFAYPELTWAPLPIMQSYSAYTPGLDRLNADRLASAEAPERTCARSSSSTIRQPGWWASEVVTLPGESIPFTVDGRYRWFEAPVAMLQTFCRFGS